MWLFAFFIHLCIIMRIIKNDEKHKMLCCVLTFLTIYGIMFVRRSRSLRGSWEGRNFFKKEGKNVHCFKA